MRTKKGVNRNCSDEGSFFDELWKSAGVIVNCCRIGTGLRDESKQAASNQYSGTQAFTVWEDRALWGLLEREAALVALRILVRRVWRLARQVRPSFDSR
jgi:hypothetical protein